MISYPLLIRILLLIASILFLILMCYLALTFSGGDIYLEHARKAKSNLKKNLTVLALGEFEKETRKPLMKYFPKQQAKWFLKIAICYIDISDVEDRVINLMKAINKLDEGVKLIQNNKNLDTYFKLIFYQSWANVIIGEIQNDINKVRLANNILVKTLDELNSFEKISKHLDIIWKYAILGYFYFNKDRDKEFGQNVINNLTIWIKNSDVIRSKAYYIQLNQFIALCYITMSRIGNRLDNLHQSLSFLHVVSAELNKLPHLPIGIKTELLTAHIYIELARSEEREFNIKAAIAAFNNALIHSESLNHLKLSEAIKKDINNTNNLRIQGYTYSLENFETNRYINDLYNPKFDTIETI